MQVAASAANLGLFWNESQAVVGPCWYVMVMSINDNNIYKALEYLELLNNEIEEESVTGRSAGC